MCTSKYILYSCGCKKETEFVQCEERQGTNIKCEKIDKAWEKDSPHYCSGHLVKPGSRLKYTDQNRGVAEE
ncbi:hypothetical protein B0T11DRAFT_272294 [Plectosphaerella cucumerina]|uniref:Uncharacterized protein n=1 Tax=Plectosphaerella cucumerina TaxID=40658 RepID=A0A8K0TUL0_9PEZI|nr:hypothetical protein B0T11DRAFT_272294 [Plectosphaerella cucumerina]